MTSTNARRIANLLAAIVSCETSGNVEWQRRHTESLDRIVKDTGPSGSGFDIGTEFNYTRSTPDKLIFETSFHHMDQWGGYSRWTDHTITVRASLAWGIDVRVGGRNHNDIKDYVGEVFTSWLENVEDSQPETV